MSQIVEVTESKFFKLPLKHMVILCTNKYSIALTACQEKNTYEHVCTNNN